MNSLLTFAIVAQHVLRRDQRALSPDHVRENGAIPRATAVTNKIMRIMENENNKENEENKDFDANIKGGN